MFTSRITRGEALAANSWPARELLDQVAQQRSRAEPSNAWPVGAGGHIHFSMVALMQNRDGIATRLQAGPYAQPALVPATPWLDATPVPMPMPMLSLPSSGTRVTFSPGAGSTPRQWAVWLRRAGVWQLQLLPGGERSIDAAGADRMVLSAVDRVGKTSPRARLSLV